MNKINSFTFQYNTYLVPNVRCTH